MSLFLLSPSWRAVRNWYLNPHYNREKGGGLKMSKIFLWKFCETNCETQQRKSPFSLHLTKSRFDILRVKSSFAWIWVPAIGTSSHLMKRCLDERLKQISFGNERGLRLSLLDTNVSETSFLPIRLWGLGIWASCKTDYIYH